MTQLFPVFGGELPKRLIPWGPVYLDQIGALGVGYVISCFQTPFNFHSYLAIRYKDVREESKDWGVAYTADESVYGLSYCDRPYPIASRFVEGNQGGPQSQGGDDWMHFTWKKKVYPSHQFREAVLDSWDLWYHRSCHGGAGLWVGSLLDWSGEPLGNQARAPTTWGSTTVRWAEHCPFSGWGSQWVAGLQILQDCWPVPGPKNPTIGLLYCSDPLLLRSFDWGQGGIVGGIRFWNGFLACLHPSRSWGVFFNFEEE